MARKTRSRQRANPRKIAPRLAVFTVLFLVLLGTGVYGFLLTTLPRTTGSVALRGLAADATITRNKHGVPLIRAASEDDAHFALGFAHAQDRFFQMEMMRRFGAGRLAEVIGGTGLETDKYVRTLGLRRLAAKQASNASPELRAALNAYAAGVNAWLDVKHWPKVPEFLPLRHEPEPWTPADSLVWGKLMALRLSGNWRAEILRANLRSHLTAEQVEQLWPQDRPGAPVTLDRPVIPPGDWAWPGAVPLAAPRVASNAWALSGGARTSTAKPLLANDPHLRFQAPVMWYLARIETPGRTIAGATAPGVPMMVVGHNGHVAWGFTTTGADVEDVFFEELIAGDAARYRDADGPQPFKVREEIIRVRDEEPVTLTVRATRRGPILSGVRDGLDALGDGYLLSLRATYLDPTDKTPDALYRFGKATSWNELETSLRDFHSPVQNVFAADVDGSIGYVTAGRIPIRRFGDGLYPRHGWERSSGWNGYLPFERLPRRVNPENGVIGNANNRVVPLDHPDLISRTWDAPYRAERLREILAARAAFTPDEAAAPQLDTLSVMARTLTPLMLSRLEEPLSDGERRQRDGLNAWNFEMRADSRAPLLISFWLTRLKARLFADELQDDYKDFWGFRVRAIQNALTRHTVWCDDVSTARAERCGERVTAAFREAVADMTAMDTRLRRPALWGDAHVAEFGHPILSRIGPLKRAFTLSTPTDGGNFTLHRGAAWYREGPKPFTNKHGASLRVLFDLSNLDKSRFTIATGQSGNVLSQHYADQLDRWAGGGWITLGNDWTQEDRRFRSLLLTPANE